MNKSVHIWQHTAGFCAEWEMFQKDDAEKIEIHVLCSQTFS